MVKKNNLVNKEILSKAKQIKNMLTDDNGILNGKNKLSREELLIKARQIKLLLTDCDGVLTDTSVYYSANGEEFKKFSIRDGMGVERLRDLANVETGIITGEKSVPVQKRAEKLKITEVHFGIKNKVELLHSILTNKKIDRHEVAFIGDDVNDIEIMKMVGLSACPKDATNFTKEIANYICENKGGKGAFREFAELIIFSKLN